MFETILIICLCFGYFQLCCLAWLCSLESELFEGEAAMRWIGIVLLPGLTVGISIAELRNLLHKNKGSLS